MFLLEQEAAKKMQFWLTAWGDGSMDRQEFDMQCRRTMQLLWRHAFLAGARVKRFWRDILLGSETAKLNELLKRHLDFWANFVQQLAQRKQQNQPFDNLIQRRLADYTKPARGAFEWALVLNASPTAEFYWDLQRSGIAPELPQVESCGPCVELSKRSPIKRADLQFVPGEGRTPCLVRCTCHLRVKEPGNG